MKAFRSRFILFLFLFVFSAGAFAFAYAIPSLLLGTAGILARVNGALQATIVPIGGMSLGAGALGFLYRLTSDKTVWVSPFDTNTEPNPDIETVPPSPVSGGYSVSIAGISYPYVYIPSSVSWGGGCNGSCPITSATVDAYSRLKDLLATFGYNIYSDPADVGQFWWYTGSNSNCPDISPASACVAFRIIVLSGTALNSLPVTTGIRPSSLGLVMGSSLGSNRYSATLFVPVDSITPPITCVASSYSYALSTCMGPSSGEASADGVCRISWSPVNGCPIYSPFDSDCVSSESQIALSCGTSNSPPSVKIVDPASSDQKSVEVVRPHSPAQGVPGSLSVKERSSDPSNNTTTERRSDISSPPYVGAPPLIQGVGQDVLPGVGTNVGATPLEQVAISNWPSSLNVNCTNCTPSSPITFPETMKIDGEVPEGTELPETPELEVSGFLDPIKDRLSSFSGIEFPAHTSQCPVLAIQFNIGGQVIDESSTFLCDLLDDWKDQIKLMMALAFTGIAISIVLRT